MEPFDLIFFQKANGDCPVGDFLYGVKDLVMRNKLMHQLDILEIHGNRPTGDSSKHICDGIFEIRAQTKTDITRILFFFDKNKQIVMTNGFVKKTQRIPAAEVELAKRYRNEYYERIQGKSLVAKQLADGKHTGGPMWRPRLDRIMNEAEKRLEDEKAKYQQNGLGGLKRPATEKNSGRRAR